MSTQLNQREKVLAAVVGSVVLIFLNLFLFDFFSKSLGQLREGMAGNQRQIKTMRALLNDSELWAERDAWVQAHQPKLENERTAGVEFRNYVKEVADKHTVLVEQQNVLGAERRPQFTAVVLTIQTKSSPKDLVGFMRDLQNPEQFVVFESASLHIDPQDQTQMRGNFRVAKWYAK